MDYNEIKNAKINHFLEELELYNPTRDPGRMVERAIEGSPLLIRDYSHGMRNRKRRNRRHPPSGKIYRSLNVWCNAIIDSNERIKRD